MQGHIDPHTQNQRERRSHINVAAHSSLAKSVLSKQFSPFRSFSGIRSLGLFPLPKTCTRDFLTEVLCQSWFLNCTMPFTPTLWPLQQGQLMLN